MPFSQSVESGQGCSGAGAEFTSFVLIKPWWLYALSFASDLLSATGQPRVKNPSHTISLKPDLLCDLGQVSALLWALVSPSVK